MSNRIKTLREQSGLTQTKLAKQSGLSLRTIQRIESSDQAPKGHSLAALAATFDLDPVSLSQSYLPPSEGNSDEAIDDQVSQIKLINLSVLICIIIPYGNLILPYYLWSKHKGNVLVDAAFKRIYSFQIIWSIAFVIGLSCAPFLDNKTGPMPLILIVLFTMYVINLLAVGHTAQKIHQGNLNILDIPIKLLH